jgi:arylsulfate sulfotransferase
MVLLSRHWRGVATLLTATLLFTTSCKKETTEDPIVFRKEMLAAPFPSMPPLSFNKGELLVMDYEGNVLKRKGLSTGAVNFQRWEIDNKIYYTYIQFENRADKIQGVGYIPGPAVLLDQDLNELNRFYLLPNGNRTLNDPNALDGHDFILLGENHFMSMAYYEKPVNNIPAELNPMPDCKVVAPILQEVKNGKVIWEWDGTNYPELYSSSVEANFYNQSAVPNDYAHVNSMFIDPKDNNIIASFRNTDQVLKINRQTGNIMWRLGGKNSDFPMTDDQRFLRQHHATYINDNTILIFDNGFASSRNNTRIVEYTIDETTRTIKSFKKTNVPQFCQFMGSVQKIGNDYLVGGGSQPYIWRINANTGAIVFEKKLDDNSYRAFQY